MPETMLSPGAMSRKRRSPVLKGLTASGRTYKNKQVESRVSVAIRSTRVQWRWWSRKERPLARLGRVLEEVINLSGVQRNTGAWLSKGTVSSEVERVWQTGKRNQLSVEDAGKSRGRRQGSSTGPTKEPGDMTQPEPNP